MLILDWSGPLWKVIQPTNTPTRISATTMISTRMSELLKRLHERCRWQRHSEVQAPYHHAAERPALAGATLARLDPSHTKLRVRRTFRAGFLVKTDHPRPFGGCGGTARRLLSTAFVI